MAVKKLVLSIVIILAGLFAIDRAGGFVMDCVGRISKDGFSPKFQYIQKEIHQDVLFLGASRCEHHYVPGIIADSLGRSVYNVGFGSSDNIYSHYIVLSHILERYSPQMICLEVMPSDYCRQEDPFTFISLFAPLIGKSERADSVFRQAGSYWKYQMSHLYRYNAKASSNLWGLVLDRHKGNDNGYTPLKEPAFFLSHLSKEYPDKTVDPLKIEYMERFATLCRQNNIELVFIVSPKYTLVEPSGYEVLKGFASKHSIPFLDFHTSGLYHDHPDYFKDEGHLWDRGARLFSSVVAQDLKHIIRCSN